MYIVQTTMQALALIFSVFSVNGFWYPSSVTAANKIYKLYSSMIIVLALLPISMKMCRIALSGFKTLEQFIDLTYMLPDFTIGVMKGLHVLKKQDSLKAISKQLRINQCAVRSDKENLIKNKFDRLGR